MGERTRFHPGEEAPNDGVYVEIGMQAHHMGIENPRRVELKKGEKMPSTTNHERKWVLEREKKTVH